MMAFFSVAPLSKMNTAAASSCSAWPLQSPELPLRSKRAILPSKTALAGIKEAVGNEVLPVAVGHFVLTDGCGQDTPPEACHLIVLVEVVRVEVVLVDWADASSMASTSPKRVVERMLENTSGPRIKA